MTYPGSQRVLFSPLLSNPLVKLAGFFGFNSTHNFQNWKERVDWLLTIGSIDYVF
jgi:hypothetical protein